ncbi:MAG: excinuclease ABC subunit C [Bacteroidetes bacterium]|nr:excinuclease ABC subunit C [Bacteroidota bacterium]
MPYPTQAIEEIVRTLPENPGVYRYYDQDNQLLYIGKAKNLRKRVSSYFTKGIQVSARIQVMASKVRTIEYSVVGTEFEALLLENSLIKQHQPKYNINLKDGKTYPFITIKKERFPRVFAMRNRVDDGSEYYGPYSSISRMRIILDVLRKLFPLRTCNLALGQAAIDAGKFKVCLEYQIGLCLGPCEGLQSEIAYNESIKQVRHILRGNHRQVIDYLKVQMDAASAQLQFERAEQWREKLELLQHYTHKSTVVNPAIHNVDVCNYYTYNRYFFVNYLKVVEGTVVQTHTVEFRNLVDEDPEDLLLYALTDIRNKYKSTSTEIILPMEVEYAGGDLHFVCPKIGDKHKLLDLSKRNAMAYAQQKLKAIELRNPMKRSMELMERMKSDLGLKALPKHIECFDNSNMQGSYPVSSCVVFKDGKPSKSDYRIFNVKTVGQIDDFATMEEVVYRRYRRLTDEGQALPNLIVIDGGKGQLGAAVKSLEKVGIFHQIEVIGIAKRLEELYKPGDSIPMHVDKASDTLKVIQHLRNEAHRFAITAHRNRRSKGSFKTELIQIEGIGEKTAADLLRHFKSIKKIRESTEAQMADVIGPAKAALVAAYLASTASV